MYPTYFCPLTLENYYLKMFLGLGFETALALASKGCRVIIADVAKGPEAAEKIKQQTQNPHVISN